MGLYNHNAGYGMSLMANLPLRLSGKVFVVGDSNTVDYDRIQQLFGVDPDGVLRQHDTIDAAVGECRANAGDIILVAPGHTETITAAAGLDLDVAGIKLIGLGQGDDRPQINFTTAVTADMDVDGDNIYMENFLFTGGIDALTGPVDINADDFTLKNCEYRDVTGQTTDAFIVTGDRCTIDGFYFAGSTSAGAESAIQINGTDRFSLTNFHIDGNFATSPIESTGTGSTNIKVNKGFVRNRNSADIIISHVDTDTGDIGPDLYFRLADNAANITEAIDTTTDCQFWDPIYVANADSERGLQWNHTQSSD